MPSIQKLISWLHETIVPAFEEPERRQTVSIEAIPQRFIRVRENFPISLKLPEGAEIYARALDLSVGGMGIEDVKDPHRFIQTFEIRFVLPGTDILVRTEARLVWLNESGRAGIQFVDLKPPLCDFIHRWVSQRLSEAGQ